MVTFFAKGINFLFGNVLQDKKVFLSGSLQYVQRKRSIDKNYFDYIRLSTLELIAHEISEAGLKGSVAELGVYKGKFARYINFYFPQRKLYLFDTFEGFDQRDVQNEKAREFSSGSQDFTNTSVASVISRMPFPQQCTAVQGFFPASAASVNDSFVFVSLDTDLYDPIYEGLNFFYPKLVKGGYLFVHDFNNDNYKGVRKAVEQFCAEQGISFVPIPDFGGSVVIAK